MGISNKTSCPMNVKIIGWVYAVLGAISILLGIIMGTSVLSLFPILDYLVVKPMSYLLSELHIGIGLGTSTVGFSDSVNLSSIFRISDGIIALVGGILLLIIGILLIKNKDIYMFMTIFSFSAFIGVFDILDFGNFYDYFTIITPIVVIIVHVFIGRYFFKLMRSEKQNGK